MIKGQTAIVTGGSRGIGAAVAKRLAEEGVNVAVIFAGNADLAESVCEECPVQRRTESRPSHGGRDQRDFPACRQQ